jgi:L-2,4-diaminobutyrate decarboxylase
LAGTTNLGAVDDLHALHRIAGEAWMHVDAAYGGSMLFSAKQPDLLNGLSLADSVTIDPHRGFMLHWMGAILVKDHKQLTVFWLGTCLSYRSD